MKINIRAKVKADLLPSDADEQKIGYYVERALTDLASQNGVSVYGTLTTTKHTNKGNIVIKTEVITSEVDAEDYEIVGVVVDALSGLAAWYGVENLSEKALKVKVTRDGQEAAYAAERDQAERAPTVQDVIAAREAERTGPWQVGDFVGRRFKDRESEGQVISPLADLAETVEADDAEASVGTRRYGDARTRLDLLELVWRHNRGAEPDEILRTAQKFAPWVEEG